MGTKTVSASKLRQNLADGLDAANKEDILIVTRRGKSEKAIIDIDVLEDLLAASNPEYLASIAEARAEVSIGDTVDIDEAFGDI